MMTRYDAIMDGVALSSLHEDLAVLDILHDPGKKRYATNPKGMHDGAFISNRYQEQTTVSIVFELHIYNPAERQLACQEVARWAKGKILEVSDRPGQRLHVICETPPSISSAAKWTSEITMTFVAYARPLWEEAFPAEITLTGSDENALMYVPGNGGKAAVDAEITASGQITQLILSCGTSYLQFTGLSVPANGVIIISHETDGILTAMYNGNSILGNRSGKDDIVAESGELNEFSVYANNNVVCKFSVRGVWL